MKVAYFNIGGNNDREKEFVRIPWEDLGLSVKAEVLKELNPIASYEFIKSLPYKSIQSHAVVAGSQIYCPFRLILDSEACTSEEMSTQPIDGCSIELDLQYLSINCGIAAS